MHFDVIHHLSIVLGHLFTFILEKVFQPFRVFTFRLVCSIFDALIWDDRIQILFYLEFFLGTWNWLRVQW